MDNSQDQTGEIKTQPAIVGPAARAWRCDIDKALGVRNVDPQDDAAVAAWIVEAPWAHPAWHSYAIMLLHLRPLKGRPTAKLYLPNASHEMWVQALDPSMPREPAISEGGLWYALSPNNFAAQFIAPDDAAAVSRVENAVRRICVGTLSPDTDFMCDWVALFGDNMIRPEFRPSAPPCSFEAH